MAAVWFVVSSLVVIACGIGLTRYSDALAHRTGLGRLWGGSVFLAIATSLPELSVDAAAAWQGLPDVAVGGLIGSSLFNLLILGILDLMQRSRGRLLSRASAAHALSGVLGIVLLAIAAICILIAPLGSVGPLSVGTVVIVLAWVLGVRLIYFDQRAASLALASGATGPVEMPTGLYTMRHAVIGYTVTAGAILLVGPLLASSAGELAEETGLGQTFLGTTLVALATSLPEVVTATTAVRMGALDLALGNIFGSNSFNVVLLVVADALHSAPLLTAVSSTHAFTCLAAILVTGVAVLGQLYRVEGRKRFLEPDAWLVMSLVCGSLVVLWFLRDGAT